MRLNKERETENLIFSTRRVVSCLAPLTAIKMQMLYLLPWRKSCFSRPDDVLTWNAKVMPLWSLLLGWTAALMMRPGEAKLPRLSVSLFIQMEGVDKCGRERNWWVKHLSPEELYLRLRATVVNFNYHSRARYSTTINAHTWCTPVFYLSGLYI